MRFAEFSRYVEVISCVAILALLSVWSWMYFSAMATTSLWNDELYTIANFSSKGLYTVVSDYSVPNNHIFFNALNAIMPASDSFEPIRARFWSFVVIIMTSIYILIYFFRKRLYFEGSMCLFVLLGYSANLDLALQARGYGFLFCCAAVSTIINFEYFLSDKPGYLVALGILTVIGVWTVPTYAFFSAPLLLLTFLYKPSWFSFLTGFSAASLILVLHIPVLDQMLESSENYADQWGSGYSSVRSVFATISTHLTPFGLKDWALFLVLFSSLMSPIIFARGQTSESKNGQISSEQISISVIVFFTACLFLETPLIRTTSFIAMPIAILAIRSFGFFTRILAPNSARMPIYLLVSIIMGSYIYGNIKSFNFIPKESWKGVARFIENTFPPDTEVVAEFRLFWLSAYLSSDYEISKKFSKARFIDGKQIVVDSDHFQKHEERFQAETYSPAAASVKILQRRGGYQKIAFLPESGKDYIRKISLNGGNCECYEILDRKNETRWSTGSPQSNIDGNVRFTFDLHPGKKYRSLVIVSRNGDLPLNFEVSTRAGGLNSKISSDSIFISDDIMVISLEDNYLDSIDLLVRPYPTKHFFSINELWLYESK